VQKGKPEAMLEKSFGKVNKILQRNALLNQGVREDNSKTIAQYLDGVKKD